VSSTRIGVGIVGLSADRGWAAKAHVPALAMLSGYELRGLVASSPESGRAAASKHGVQTFSRRLDDLLARRDIDLVVVSIKVPEHRRVVEYWPLPGDRSTLAYNVALAYASIARDLQTGSHTAPTIADAVRLHRTLGAIELAA